MRSFWRALFSSVLLSALALLPLSAATSAAFVAAINRDVALDTEPAKRRHGEPAHDEHREQHRAERAGEHRAPVLPAP